MTRPKVFIAREIPKKGIDMISEYYDVEVWDKYQPPPRDVYVEKIKDIDALVSLLSDKINRELLSYAKKLRIIAQYAVGYDNIDVDACTEKGIYVTNTPGVLSESVADLTIGLILAITRRIVEGDKFVRSGEWERLGTAWHPNLMVGMDLKGKVLGIVGMGGIGYEVAKRAKVFGMKIIYYDVIRKENVEKDKLDDRLTMWISNDELTSFKIKSSRMGFPYQIMIREMIKAFNEDRMKITPTD
ncbi:MAG: NAD(P)-dependent oxidoreductase, partial [Candidatus Asgardarchaeia archaeon]